MWPKRADSVWPDNEERACRIALGGLTFVGVARLVQAVGGLAKMSAARTSAPLLGNAAVLAASAATYWAASSSIEESRGGVLPLVAVPPRLVLPSNGDDELRRLARLAADVLRGAGERVAQWWAADEQAPASSADARESLAQLHSELRAQPPTDLRSPRSVVHARQLVVAGLLGCLIFRLLGGRGRALFPSDVRYLGAFSQKNHSLPAQIDYATEFERGSVAAIGRLIGCHSCGTRGADKWIADHMPPISFIRNKAKWYHRYLGFPQLQRFYPQCGACSLIQQQVCRPSFINKSTRKALRFHFFHFRPHDFTGLGVATAACVFSF